MEKTDIKVTVFCAAYNQELYIRDALEGFVNQKTNFAFEVLVHDDASTDSTADIIREYEEKYPDIIKPIYQPENIYTKKINRTFTYMLPRTRGKYIAFCEGDDYWIDPNKLQSQYDYMEAHPECSLVAHEALTYYMDEGYFTKYVSRDYTKPENCQITTKDILKNHLLFPTASMFFRREYYENNREFLLNIRALDYVAKTLLSTEGTVYVLPKVMSVYRKGTQGSWTNVILKDKSKFAAHLESSVATLRAIDEYRGFAYHDLIEQNILQRTFDMNVTLRNFAELKKEPLLGIYKKMSTVRKLMLFVQRYFPWLYKLARRVQYFIKKRRYGKNKKISDIVPDFAY